MKSKNLSVFFLVAVMLFPIGIHQSYAAITTNEVMITELQPAFIAPVASDITIEILNADTAARTVILPFNTLATDATDMFDDLTITFSVLDDARNAQINHYVGTNVTGTGTLGNDEVATVSGAEPVTVRYDYTGFNPPDAVIDYTATDSSGRSDTGRITITVSNIPVLMANPHTVTLASSDFPTITSIISASDVESTILAGTLVASPSLIRAAVIGDIGTGDAARGESATGSDLGTLVVTQPTGTVRLVYTPATGFSGTETFDYTVTIQGKTASSEFRFVVPVPPVIITANIHTVTLLNLFGLPTINLPISNTVIIDTLLQGSTLSGIALESSSLTDIIFTTNGTGSTSAGVANTGNASGTITITAATSSSSPIFHYTPNFEGLATNDYPYTEAFAYNATLNGVLGSSTLYIDVPLPGCGISMIGGFNFNSLSDGVTSAEQSMSVVNTGNTNNQFMIRGEGWKSAADDTTPTMNVGITRYSLTDADTSLSVREAYDTKTALTVAPVGLGDISQNTNPVPVYLQLTIALLNEAFTGATTQELTVSSDCN